MQYGKRDGWLVPMVDRIGYDVVQAEMRRFGEVLAVIPEDRRHFAVQAGGHIGIVPKELAKHFHLVYTFEPVPANFVCLVHNACEDNVLRYQACLGAYGSRPVMIEEWGDNTSYGHVGGGGPFPCVPLDHFRLPGLDLLMLDVEGYEWHALEGAFNTIKQYKPASIVVELVGHGARYGHPDQDVEDLLSELGYKFHGALDRDRIYVPVD